MIKHRVLIMLFCSLFVGASGISQQQPRMVSLIQLLAAPQQYDGTLITVKAFLLAQGGHHDVSAYTLCFSKEDAENELGNSILVVPNDEMKKNLEKFDRMYVILTGTIKGVRGADGGYIAAVKDVRECRVWSDPNHPILLKEDSSPRTN